jgi:hypothetical protein
VLSVQESGPLGADSLVDGFLLVQRRLHRSHIESLSLCLTTREPLEAVVEFVEVFVKLADKELHAGNAVFKASRRYRSSRRLLSRKYPHALSITLWMIGDN